MARESQATPERQAETGVAVLKALAMVAQGSGPNTYDNLSEEYAGLTTEDLFNILLCFRGREREK